MAVCASSAVDEFSYALIKAKLTEVISLASFSRGEMLEYYALHGTWPTAEKMPPYAKHASNAHVRSMSFTEDGNLSVIFHPGDNDLEYTFSLVLQSDDPLQWNPYIPVRWQCSVTTPALPEMDTDVTLFVCR